jgi:hypothetical protein
LPVKPPQSPPQSSPHEAKEKTFGRIYLNDRAAGEFSNAKPAFPPGSIIVREKLLTGSDEDPASISVMIKRDRGYSPRSNDWEFFVLDGTAQKVIKSERAGSCLKCHSDAKATDMVFRPYVK